MIRVRSRRLNGHNSGIAKDSISVCIKHMSVKNIYTVVYIAGDTMCLSFSRAPLALRSFKEVILTCFFRFKYSLIIIIYHFVGNFMLDKNT